MILNGKKNIYDYFLGSLIKKGNKLSAKKILYTALTDAAVIVKQKPDHLLKKVFSKLQLHVEIKKIKRRKYITIVPTPVVEKRRFYLVVKFLLEAAKEDKRRISFSNKLCNEIISTLTKKSSKSLLKKRQVITQSLLNRSNIHYRW
jgi:small subunit ribosomal protein S7